MASLIASLAAIACVALSVTAWIYNRRGQLERTRWLDLFALIPTAVAIVANVADGTLWLAGLWLASGALTVASIVLLTRRINARAADNT